MIRTPFNYDKNAASLESAFRSDEPSMTAQEFRDEVDINSLVSLFLRTGIPQAPVPSQFVEFAERFDFQSAMNGLVQAKNQFAAMPSNIRDRFQNDPSRLMAFLADSDNRLEAEKLGLILTPPAPVPAPIPVENPPVAQSTT